MKKHLFLFITVFLSIALSCGKNRKPVLSDKELFAQKETTDTVRQMTSVSDTGTYVVPVVPPGIKYQESRSIDPEFPPVNFDISNRKLNIKKFNLANYYTKVRFVKLKHPMLASEGNFLFDANYRVTYDGGSMSGSGLSSRFSFMKDSIIAGDVFFGYYSYDNEGNFLHTVKTYDFPKSYDAVKNTISYDLNDYQSAMEKAGNRRNNNLFRVDDNTLAKYVYNTEDTLSRDFLFTFGTKGDTLCRFRNYNQIPVMKKLSAYPSPLPPDIYFYNKQLTVRQSMNDTVYRVIPPNRLLPVYVLNFGPYKIDIQTFIFGDHAKYLLPYTWKETNRYILFVYTQNRDTPNNRSNGSVKFFYSYYDKKNRQLYHFSEGTTIPEQELLVDNQVPNALPFILSSAEIGEDGMKVVYSKRRLEDIIKNKGFASLSPEQQKKLKTVQSELGESEVLIMILE